MSSPHSPISARQFLVWSALSLGLIIAWDVGGLDLELARWFGTAQGFPLQHNWWLEKVLHSKMQRFAWIVTLGLALMIRWPLGPFRAMPRADRAWLVVGILLAVLAIQLLKRGSHTSCPWSLTEFGGKAAYVSHWLWGVRDGGRGHCFPAGHASTAFCYLAAYFWLRPWAPRMARIWLAATVVAGLALGGVQMVRGAHYLSHVLWSGWFCWVVGGTFWFTVQALRARQKSKALNGSQPP